MDRLLEQVTDHAFKSPAGHHIAVGLNCEVTVSTVAAIINCVGIAVLRYLEQSLLIKEKSPQMIFEVEDGS